MSMNSHYHKKRIGNPKNAGLASAIRMALTHCEMPKPCSVLDVGCSVGALLAELDWFETRVGIDIAKEAKTYWAAGDARFIRMDLNNPQPGILGQRFDVLVCLEVAEHLRADGTLYDMPLFKLLDIAAQSGSVLFFGGATPKQRGIGHINAHAQYVWRDCLERHGWMYHHEASMLFAYRLGQVNGMTRRTKNLKVGRCYRNNTMVLQKVR